VHDDVVTAQNRTWNWVIGSMGHLGHLSRPGHRVTGSSFDLVPSLLRTIVVNRLASSALVDWEYRNSGILNRPNTGASLDRVVSASDCGVRGSRFESHCGRLCLSRPPLRYAALGTGCAPLLVWCLVCVRTVTFQLDYTHGKRNVSPPGCAPSCLRPATPCTTNNNLVVMATSLDGFKN